MGLLDGLVDLLYPGKQYGSRSKTPAGVEVRSRAERKIADYFDSLGLSYQYEKPLHAGVWIFTRKVSSPDFYLPDHDVYVEYWGLLDADNVLDREKYKRSMDHKIFQYRNLGVRLVSLYPADLARLDAVFRERFEQATGKRLALS